MTDLVELVADKLSGPRWARLVQAHAVVNLVLERAAFEMEMAAHVLSHHGNECQVQTYQNAAKIIRALGGEK